MYNLGLSEEGRDCITVWLILYVNGDVASHAVILLYGILRYYFLLCSPYLWIVWLFCRIHNAIFELLVCCGQDGLNGCVNFVFKLF